MGAKDEHTLKAFLEAEAYDGPALIIAYSHCIAHGINMTTAMQNQKAAVDTGQWLLYRYNPDLAAQGENPFRLDSSAPKTKVEQYLNMENRFKMLTKTNPQEAKMLFAQAQEDVNRRWQLLSPRQTRIQNRQRRKIMNLSTTYLGMKLRTPLVPSASPLCDSIDDIRKMEDAGAAAVVLSSLFEDQIRHERQELHHYLTEGTESYAEALSYFPEPAEFRLGPEEYLQHIAKAKDSVGIPIIASVNGSTIGGWTDYAKQIEQAGADALELNIYSIPTDLHISSTQVENTYLDILTADAPRHKSRLP